MGRMPDTVLASLRCPVCGASFTRTGDTVSDSASAGGAPGSVRCAQGHTFDVARQGYLNLTAGRPPAANADTAAMVAARADFLAAGHYAPLATLLAETAAKHAGDGLVLDAGAGTGYYPATVLDALPGAAGLAMDISPLALRRAARAHDRLGAIVADVWRPWPVADGVAGVLLNVFAPRNGAEFARVLRPDGALLVVTPGPEHLAELGRDAGLLAVDPDKDRRLAATLDADFRLVDRQSIVVPLRLSALDVWRVVHMGPAGHHRTDPPPAPSRRAPSDAANRADGINGADGARDGAAGDTEDGAGDGARDVTAAFTLSVYTRAGLRRDLSR